MTTLTPVLYTTPDGVERELRFALGTRKLIIKQFGTMDFARIMAEHGDEAIADLIYFCLFDEQGNPPAGVTPEYLLWKLPGDSIPGLVALFLSAVTQGRSDPKELEVLIVQALSKDSTGSTFGALPISASESETEPSSGGDTPKPSSLLSANDTGSESESSTSGPEPSALAS